MQPKQEEEIYKGNDDVAMTSNPRIEIKLKVAPEYSETADTLQSPPTYDEIVTVTSQYVQELISPMSPDDQSSIMALYYSNPKTVEGCVNDIKDTEELRAALLRIAKSS